MDKKILELEKQLIEVKLNIEEQWYTKFLMKEKQLIKKEISELIYLKNKKWKKH